MHKRCSLWFVAVAMLVCAPVSVAQQDSPSAQGTTLDESTGIDSDESGNDVQRRPIPDNAEMGIVRRSILIVDDAQAAASEQFGSFMGQVDGFFSRAGSNEDAVSNESWARIRLDGVRANNEDFEIDPSFKLRAVLPRTERKLKLLVSTEDDEGQETGDRQQVPAGGNQNASLALRFIRTARVKSNINIDIGLRQRDGDVQYFGRLNTRYTWEKGVRGALISHTTGLYWQLDSARSLALEGLASYHTSLNRGVTDRFNGHEFRIRWRQNIWRPWLFYEIWPSVAWPSVTQYRQANGILVRLEVVIGQKS